MTSEQMFYNFRVELDKFRSSIEITSDDIEYFLNKAQEKFIEQRFNGMNYTRRGFEQSAQIISELKPLFKKGEELDVYYPDITTPDNFELDRADLPDSLLYFVSSTCQLTYVLDASDIEVNTGVNPNVRKVVDGEDSATLFPIMKYVQNDDIYQVLRDPFNKSSFKKVIIDINENYLDIYTNNTSFVSKVIINYIRNPLAITYVENGHEDNQDCELPDFTHKDIIELAVQMFLKTESNQTQEN